MSYIVDVLSKNKKRKEKEKKMMEEISFNVINCPCS
jgi:hypothetical protein